MRFYSFTSYTRLGCYLLTSLIHVSPIEFWFVVFLFLLDRCLFRKLEVLFVFHRRNRPPELMSIYRDTMDFAFRRFSGSMDRCTSGTSASRAGQLGSRAAASCGVAASSPPGSLHLSGQGLVTTAKYFALWRALAELKAEPALGIKPVEGTDTVAHTPL